MHASVAPWPDEDPTSTKPTTTPHQKPRSMRPRDNTLHTRSISQETFPSSDSDSSAGAGGPKWMNMISKTWKSSSGVA
ncbi:hypothetical protein HK097_002155, partial [Rhizophlyctis rosea]